MFIGVAIVVVQVKLNSFFAKNTIFVQGIIELGGFNQVINIAIEGERLKLFK